MESDVRTSTSRKALASRSRAPRADDKSARGSRERITKSLNGRGSANCAMGTNTIGRNSSRNSKYWVSGMRPRIRYTDR